MAHDDRLEISPEIDAFIDNATPQQLSVFFDLGADYAAGPDYSVAWVQKGGLTYLLSPEEFRALFGRDFAAPRPQEMGELSGTFKILMAAASNPFAIKEVS